MKPDPQVLFPYITQSYRHMIPCRAGSRGRMIRSGVWGDPQNMNGRGCTKMLFDPETVGNLSNRTQNTRGDITADQTQLRVKVASSYSFSWHYLQTLLPPPKPWRFSFEIFYAELSYHLIHNDCHWGRGPGKDHEEEGEGGGGRKWHCGLFLYMCLMSVQLRASSDAFPVLVRERLSNLKSWRKCP